MFYGLNFLMDTSMKELIITRYKDLIAFILVLICVIALFILDTKITDSLRQKLYAIIGICSGFLFRGR